MVRGGGGWRVDLLCRILNTGGSEDISINIELDRSRGSQGGRQTPTSTGDEHRID